MATPSLMDASPSLKEITLAIWNAGLAAVDPEKLVKQNIAVAYCGSDEQLVLKIAHREFPRDSLRRIIVVGAGKAAEAMAAGIEESLRPIGSLFSRLEGLVNAPGQGPSRLRQIEACYCRPSGVNLPTTAVVTASKRILNLIDSADDRDLCIFLISGGASALLEVPADPVSLADLCRLTELLTQNGTPIEELNLVRSHLSQIKRGGLLTHAAPAHSVALILSDVVGNPLEWIGSGPTVFAAADPEMALHVLYKRISDRSLIPDSVITRFDRLIAETSSQQPGPIPSARHTNELIGSLETAVEACVEKATQLGFESSSTILADEGDTSETALLLIDRWKQQQNRETPQCLIIGGEPTVKVSEHCGTGGRNTHLILETLLHLLSNDDRPPFENACIASLSTDGEDGNAPASGAILAPDALRRVSRKHLLGAAQAAHMGFDSYQFLEPLGAIVSNQRTRTNVGDVRIILTSKRSNPTAPLNQP